MSSQPLDPELLGLFTQQGVSPELGQYMSPDETKYLTQTDPKQQLLMSIIGALEMVGKGFINRRSGVAPQYSDTAAATVGVPALTRKREALLKNAQTKLTQKQQMEQFGKQFQMEQGGRTQLSGVEAQARAKLAEEEAGRTLGRERGNIMATGEETRMTKATPEAPQASDIFSKFNQLVQSGFTPDKARSILEMNLTQGLRQPNQANAIADNIWTDVLNQSTAKSMFGGTKVNFERMSEALDNMKKVQPPEVQAILEQRGSLYRHYSDEIKMAKEALMAGANKKKVVEMLYTRTGLKLDELPEEFQ